MRTFTCGIVTFILSESTSILSASGVTSLRCLEVDDDVHGCLIRRHFDPLYQFQGVQAIEGAVKVHEQSRKLVMPFGAFDRVFRCRSHGVFHGGRHTATINELQYSVIRR
jgi:hypothetical protein